MSEPESEPDLSQLTLVELGQAVWSRAYRQGYNVGFRDAWQEVIATVRTKAGEAYAKEDDTNAKALRGFAKMLAEIAPTLDAIREEKGNPNEYPLLVELEQRDLKQQEEPAAQ